MGFEEPPHPSSPSPSALRADGEGETAKVAAIHRLKSVANKKDGYPHRHERETHSFDLPLWLPSDELFFASDLEESADVFLPSFVFLSEDLPSAASLSALAALL